MKSNMKWYIILHVLLLLYAFGSVFSKLAANHEIFSLAFCMLYGGVVVVLVVYGLVWQQVIKHMPLTTAYANKAITVIWGMVLGTTIFHEQIDPTQVIGAMIIIAGIVLFVMSDKVETNE